MSSQYCGVSMAHCIKSSHTWLPFIKVAASTLTHLPHQQIIHCCSKEFGLLSGAECNTRVANLAHVV